MDGGSTYPGGGGSGGSAWVTTRMLRGTGGVIRARGGAGSHKANSGHYAGGSA